MKLFVKIFLWFLTTLALMVGVMTFLTRTFQTEPLFSRWQRSARSQLSIYGGTASQIFAGQGDAGLREYLARLSESETIKEVHLIDAAGNALGGEPVDANDFESVVERARNGSSPEIDVSRDDAAMGAIAVDVGGRPATLLIKWTPPRAPSLFFDSWLGYLRLAGVLLTAIIVCYLLALYLTSPIRKLRQATQRLAAGDLQTRVASRVVRRRDELADLARDFDEMAGRIESLITSQQRLNRDISHELRSPLARMAVALEIAKQRSTPDNTAILARIETEAERLNEMISRLLTLAKLESGAESLDPKPLQLDELVRDVADDADFEAQANSKYVVVGDVDQCSVNGNESLLRSAIENVLRNAVRYTPQGSVVDVSVKNQNGNAVVTVSDHGGGVDEKELPNLFRPFYRVGEARERTTGGTGLGLAIAERAVKAHNGTIKAKNNSNGLVVEIALKRIS